MSGEPIDAMLFELVYSAVLEAYAQLQELPEREIPRQWRWKSIGTFDNGMPSFSESDVDVPLSYGLTIGPGGGLFTKITYGEMPSFERLLEYGRSSPRLLERLAAPVHLAEKHHTRLFDHQVAALAVDVVDRLLHLQQSPERQVVLERYLELERHLLGDDLPVEVLAPILCCEVELDGRFELGGGAWIERMDNPTQLARMGLGHLAPVQDVLIGAATHAVGVTGGSVPPSGLWSWPDYSGLPTATLDRAFEALRIAAEAPVGYAQVCLRPIGWATGWTADLPPLEAGPVERRYASRLDDYGWLRPPIRITASALASAKVVFAALEDAPDKLRLAARRLGQAWMRDDEEDTIIDSCVAIEAMLGDGSRTETTHKLSFRAATVLAPREAARGKEIADWVAKVYGMRSAVVHGSTDIAKRRTVHRKDGSKLSTVAVARWLASRLLWALLTTPSLRTPKNIDGELLERLRSPDSDTTPS